MGLDHRLWNREGSRAESLCSPRRGEPLLVADPCGLVGVPPDDWMHWMLGPLVQEAPVGLLLPTTSFFQPLPISSPLWPLSLPLNVLSLPTPSQLLSRHPVTLLATPALSGTQDPKCPGCQLSS